MWEFTGKTRPEFALVPRDGQESVWDYPRPPALVPSDDQVDVAFNDLKLASSRRTLRVLETAHPPTYYIPEDDVNWEFLAAIARSSFCEWKGTANYFSMQRNSQQRAIAWQYRSPVASFAQLDGHVSFYPSLTDCCVNGERVIPQPGIFYGGWITSRVVGPFKGEPGTGHW
jgi:uncharacterized protein (DUF427 family)